ncbi:MAG: hypothetical protein J4F43_08075 [Dehalococcoidia bacterium]|nr:hypothetical protein [Dehalococcoidia bacterium]
MPNYYFERDCRTPYSESYTVLDDEHSVGRVDLHFTPTIVHCTLCVLESLTQEEVQELIETVDDDLVDAVGVYREEFIVHVYQGRDAGVYSDNGFGQNGDATEEA